MHEIVLVKDAVEKSGPISVHYDVRGHLEVVTEEKFFNRAFKLCYIIQTCKGLHYRRSWCKRGFHGIFHTIARKWDRLEEADASPNFLEFGGGECVEETVMDLAVYSLKWLGWFAETYPERFQRLVDSVQQEVDKSGVKIFRR